MILLDSGSEGMIHCATVLATVPSKARRRVDEGLGMVSVDVRRDRDRQH